MDVLFIIELGERDMGAGRGEFGGQSAKGGAVGTVGVALLGAHQDGQVGPPVASSKNQRLAFDLGVAGHHRGEAEVGADDGKAVVAAVAHTLESAGHHGQLRMSRKGGGA
ncbi:hypothetical protein [Nonomuraea sp. 10N515B]|uniref:hypothetical protein n=1 Tax=Nonomuraea sp. 10N515B TaxID=3457422 RepID=UPI003FCE7465